MVLKRVGRIGLAIYLKRTDKICCKFLPLQPSTAGICNYFQTHGDVKRFAFGSDNVIEAFDYAVEHGAIPS